MNKDWQSEIKHNICTIDQLREYTEMSHDTETKLNEVIKRHPMRITPHYLSLIDWDNPNDPIKKMAIPSLDELSLAGSYDTSGEAENTKLPGLQHKYKQTVLILATNQCATYCRYCFRKRLVGLPNNEIINKFNDAANYIQHHTEINNVLISGGDPLVLPTNIIETFLSTLSSIPHLKFIRFGSKTPITLPSRFNDNELLSTLNRYSTPRSRIYIVTQFNYPREISNETITATQNILDAGVILTNQTVLLRGINDYPKTLSKLQNNLVSIGITPYYVFQCRPVKRVQASFQIPLYKGIDIIETAKKSCNGQSKRFRYIMSHKTGKIEILGIRHEEIYFKYHQAKDDRNLGRIFKRKIDKNTGWLG